MILVLSGTEDGREIVEKLLEKNYSVLATTATEYGAKLFKTHPNLNLISKRLDKDDMKNVIAKYNIKSIVDATHPYAAEVSQNAIKAAKELNIKYFRFERKEIANESIDRFSSYEEVIKYLEDKKGNILLTTGSNNLDKFEDVSFKYNLYIRVLPTANVVKKCTDLGFLPKKILALQGPFSTEFNKSTYEFYNIKYIVTKDSGETGGTNEKIQAALDMNINVLLIDRPKIDYPNKYDSVSGLIKNIYLKYEIPSS